MGYRRLMMAAGWLLAAVVATAIGVAAVGVIGRGLTEPAGDLMTRDEIDRELAAGSSSPSAGPTASRSPGGPASPGDGQRKLFTTKAGTVLAQCDGEIAELLSWSPANGYHLREVDSRRGAEAEVSFERDDDERVKVTVTCPGGMPRMEFEDSNSGSGSDDDHDD